MTGVLFYLHKNEEIKLNADWEKTRIQTWRLLNIQLSKNDQITYDQFKQIYWPFTWEKPVITEVPEIDWVEKDRRDQERRTMTFKTEEMIF